VVSDLAATTKSWRSLLERPDVQEQFAQAVRTDINPRTIARITLTSLTRNPKLMECTQQSVLAAVVTACQLGLEPDGVSGQAYLVPYGNVCTLIPGYRGLIQLAYRSGDVLSVQAHNVYDNEVFERHVGAVPPVKHIPLPPERRGDYIGSYAVATIRGGGCVVEWMWASEIDAIRKRSKAANSGPWMTDTDEMRRKTVVRRLFKYIPSSAVMRQAVAVEDEFESDHSRFVDSREVTQTQNIASKAAAILPNQPQAPDAPDEPTDADNPPAAKGEPLCSEATKALILAAIAKCSPRVVKNILTSYGIDNVNREPGIRLLSESYAQGMLDELRSAAGEA